MGGLGNVVFPKGKDGFNAKTRTEVLLHPKVLLDVGSFLGTPKSFEAGWATSTG